MTERSQVMRLDEIEGYADEGRPRWHMIRTMLGIESFGINAWRATAAGQVIIGEHDELGEGAGKHEELYLVLSGRATFTLDGELLAASAGSLVFVKEPQIRRSAVADEAGTTVLVIGGRPGAAFSVSPWERSAEALRFWTTGEWDRAIEVLKAQLAEDPANANVLYNLACAESRGGYLEPAIYHIQEAVALAPRFAAMAQGDADLEAIRGDARFPGAPH
jgi:tetratricopeptide (TPR) repeat protein